MKYGVIQKAGATLSFEGEKIAVGFDASRLKLKEDKKLLEAIKKKTLASIVKTETEEEKKEQKKEV